MSEWLREGGREIASALLFFLPTPRRKAAERWLRGREEFLKLRDADYVLMSWGKSGRTWLRLMLSRFYQVRYDLPDRAFLQFDNLKRRCPQIPSVFFTHGNYLRNYTGHWDDKRDFYDKKILMLVRDPRDVAVSQFFQWKHRMRPRKKMLNDYPLHGEDVSIFDFVLKHDAGLPRIVEFFNVWSRELDRMRGFHVIRYEDMRARTEAELAAALEFLGTPGSPEQVAEAVRFAAFDHMKQLEQSRTFWSSGRRLLPGDRANPESYKVRRAVVGGYRDYFTDDEVEAIDAYVASKLSPRFGYVAGDRARTEAGA